MTVYVIVPKDQVRDGNRTVVAATKDAEAQAALQGEIATGKWRVVGTDQETYTLEFDTAASPYKGEKGNKGDKGEKGDKGDAAKP